jgi:hypothetical protein
MTKSIICASLFTFLILDSALYFYPIKNARAASHADGKTLVLYDAASGDIPSKSLMSFTEFPPDAASLAYSDSAAVMDTTISGSDTYAGWISSQATTSGFPTLDRTMGVQVNFSMQVESETHTNNNRAGFSVIILDRDAKGIELSFWENEIWAQGDENTGGLFRRAEGIAFAATSLTDYQVTLAGETYTLTANSELLLSGPLRDYSTFEGFPDPYETPNFLFMGDDTTSSQVRVRLRFVSVTGTELIVPTATTLSISTNTPLPLASPTPLPSATPVPSPTPTGRSVELCSSGWLIGAVMIASTRITKTVRRRRSNHR